MNIIESNNDDIEYKKTELKQIWDTLMIDLILLKGSQSYKQDKFWSQKIALFENDAK